MDNNQAPDMIGDPSLHASYYYSNPKKERTIYRSCRPDRATNYIATRDSSHIVSLDKTGDFHKDSHVRPVAYFTTDLWYAHELATQFGGSQIVRQVIPADFDVKYSATPKSHTFTTLYLNQWEQVVTANRKGMDAPKDLMALQNKDITEGPTSNVCTRAFNANPNQTMKIRGWQIGFAGPALQKLTELDPAPHIMTNHEIQVALTVESKEPAPKAW